MQTNLDRYSIVTDELSKMPAQKNKLSDLINLPGWMYNSGQPCNIGMHLHNFLYQQMIHVATHHE